MGSMPFWLMTTKPSPLVHTCTAQNQVRGLDLLQFGVCCAAPAQKLLLLRAHEVSSLLTNGTTTPFVQGCRPSLLHKTGHIHRSRKQFSQAYPVQHVEVQLAATPPCLTLTDGKLRCLRLCVSQAPTRRLQRLLKCCVRRLHLRRSFTVVTPRCRLQTLLCCTYLVFEVQHFLHAIIHQLPLGSHQALPLVSIAVEEPCRQRN